MRTLKKALCIVLALVMAVGLLTVAAGAKSLSDYSDADKVGDDYEIAVDVNTQLGILKGMTETTYEPQGTLTRAQLATIIYRIVTGDVKDTYVANYANAQRFSDVPTDAWFAGYVNYAADNGYLKGMGNGKYDPNGTLTGYQAMAALLRALGYDKNHEYEGSDWYVAVTKDAKKINDGILADWAKPISREVTAQLAFNTLFATPVMWVAALGDYIGLPDEYGFYNNPALDALGLEPLIMSVFGVEDTAFDPNVPAFEFVNEKGKAVVTIPIKPIKEYNTKIDICDLLVDSGVAKTDVLSYGYDLVQNGIYDKFTTYTHEGLACSDDEKNPDLHGQGVDTKLFDLSELAFIGEYFEGEFLVAQTFYYLAQVTDVKDDAHGSAGATTINVWCNGPGEKPIEATIASKDYPVGTWLIVHDQSKQRVETENGPRKAAYTPEGVARDTQVNTANFVVDYEPTTVTGVLKDVTVNNKEAKVTFKVDKKDYDLNIDYYMSAAMGDEDFKGRTFTFFVDKYGNLIGDIEVVSATNYAVVDKIAYVEKHLDNAYAEANIVYMDASKDANYKITKVDDQKVINAESTGEKPAYPNALSQGWEDNEPWEAPLYIISGTELTAVTDKIDNAEFVKGQILIKAGEETEEEPDAKADGETAADSIYVNSKTQFLYRTGTRGNYEYAAYTGIAKAPSFNNSTVYYVLAKDSKFAKVVFVADNSEAGNSAMDLIIPADLEADRTVYIGSNPDKIPVSYYTVYDLKGNEVEVQVKGEDATADFEALEAGLYNVAFDADGYYVPTATSLTGAGGKYASVTIAAEDVFDGEAFYDDDGTDPIYMYNFDGALVVVIGDTVTATTMSKDTSANLAKYFAEGYMFYVLSAEADKEAYTVVYVMEAAATEPTTPPEG